MKEKLDARIAQLTQERNAFVTVAQQKVAAYNGAIAELERLREQLDQAADDPHKKIEHVKVPNPN